MQRTHPQRAVDARPVSGSTMWPWNNGFGQGAGPAGTQPVLSHRPKTISLDDDLEPLSTGAGVDRDEGRARQGSQLVRNNDHERKLLCFSQNESTQVFSRDTKSLRQDDSRSEKGRRWKKTEMIIADNDRVIRSDCRNTEMFMFADTSHSKRQFIRSRNDGLLQFLRTAASLA